MADTAKHTPGPWAFKTAYNGDNGITADGTGVFAEAFAEIRHSGENARDEALANARLIAAAPDLLGVLKSIKLYGELACVDASHGFHTGGKKPATKDVFQFPRHMLTQLDDVIAKAEARS